MLTHRCRRVKENGVTLARHYAGEALRLMGVAAVEPDTMQAQLLLDWLRTLWTEPFVSCRSFVRRGPNQLRSSATIKRLVTILVDHRWLAPSSYVLVEGKPCREAFKVHRG